MVWYFVTKCAAVKFVHHRMSWYFSTESRDLSYDCSPRGQNVWVKIGETSPAGYTHAGYMIKQPRRRPSTRWSDCISICRAGFTDRLSRPNLGPHHPRGLQQIVVRMEDRVNCRYMISSINIRLQFALCRKYSRNLVLFTNQIFVDNARVLQRVSMNLNILKAVYGRTQSRLASTCLWWIVPFVIC